MKSLMLFLLSFNCFAVDSYTLDKIHRGLESEINKLPGRISIINSKMLIPSNMKMTLDLNKSTEIQSTILELKNIPLKYIPQTNSSIDQIKNESIFLREKLFQELNPDNLKDVLKKDPQKIKDSIKTLISN